MYIQERIEKVLPYLRGFAYDEATLYARFTVLFPVAWEVSYLKSKSILLGVLGQNGISNMFMVGVSTDKDLNTGLPIMDDKPFDYFLDEIERVIEINQEKERKAILLKEKMAEMQRMFSEATLQELENLKIVKDDGTSIETRPILTTNEIFMPNIKVPVQEPSFTLMEEPDFDPFSRESDDDMGGAVDLDSLPDDPLMDITMPGIVQEMIRYNNNTEDSPNL